MKLRTPQQSFVFESKSFLFNTAVGNFLAVKLLTRAYFIHYSRTKEINWICFDVSSKYSTQILPRQFHQCSLRFEPDSICSFVKCKLGNRHCVNLSIHRGYFVINSHESETAIYLDSLESSRCNSFERNVNFGKYFLFTE